MTNFEKHIRSNTDFFKDEKTDKAALWANITAELDQNESKKTISLWFSPIFKVAATVLIILGLFTTTAVIFKANQTNNTLVNQEVLDIEMYYKNLVAHQVSLIQNHTILTRTDKEDFLSFMKDLDDEYALLKLEMNKNLDNELVLEALISNYKKRIELIENLLTKVNSKKKMTEDYGYTL